MTNQPDGPGKEHFCQCKTCKKWFDMRDLRQVCEHMHAGLPVPDFDSGRRVDQPTEKLKDGPEIPLN